MPIKDSRCYSTESSVRKVRSSKQLRILKAIPLPRLAQPYYRKKLRKRERTAILSFCALQTISFNKFTTHPHSDNLAMPMCRRKQVKTSSSIQGEGAVQWQVRISSMVVPGS